MMVASFLAPGARMVVFQFRWREIVVWVGKYPGIPISAPGFLSPSSLAWLSFPSLWFPGSWHWFAGSAVGFLLSGGTRRPLESKIMRGYLLYGGGN